MKKLLGTTALVAAAFATAPAMAADKIQASVSGYFTHQIAGVFDLDQDLAPGEDDRNFNVGQEGEIHFKGAMTLDNGIEIGFKVEFELTPNTETDEAYIYVGGGFGEVQAGDQDGVADQMAIVAPSPFMHTFANDTDLDPLGSLGVAPNTVVDASGDDSKIIYFTPRLAGFQVGVSYAPEGDQAGWNSASTSLVKNDSFNEDQVEVGLTFEHSFGAFDVAVGGTYLTRQNSTVGDGSNLETLAPVIIEVAPGTGLGGTDYTIDDVGVDVEAGSLTGTNQDANDWGIGAAVEFGGFVVGGGYANKETDGVANADQNRILGESKTWNVGATYGTGPWTFGVEYAQVKRDGFRAAETGGVDVQEVDQDAWVGGLSYALGGGVHMGLGYMYKEDDGPAKSRSGQAIFTEFGFTF